MIIISTTSINQESASAQTLIKMVLLSNLFVLAPLYIYPSETAWDYLFTSIANNPTLNFKVVINPDNGPGSSAYPDANYISNIAQLNSYNNTQTIGYVHTSFGLRASADVQADVNTYFHWSKYTASDIHVDGIFLDEAPSNTSLVSYMSQQYTYIKSHLPSSGNTIITNPGCVIDSAFYKYADYVNSFENSEVAWKAGGIDATPAALRNQSTVVIYGYVSGNLDMTLDIEAIASAGYPGLFITTEFTYSVQSSQWTYFVENVVNGIKALLAGTTGTVGSLIGTLTDTTKSLVGDIVKRGGEHLKRGSEYVKRNNDRIIHKRDL